MLARVPARTTIVEPRGCGRWRLQSMFHTAVEKRSTCEALSRRAIGCARSAEIRAAVDSMIISSTLLNGVDNRCFVVGPTFLRRRAQAGVFSAKRPRSCAANQPHVSRAVIVGRALCRAEDSVGMAQRGPAQGFVDGAGVDEDSAAAEKSGAEHEEAEDANRDAARAPARDALRVVVVIVVQLGLARVVGQVDLALERPGARERHASVRFDALVVRRIAAPIARYPTGDRALPAKREDGIRRRVTSRVGAESALRETVHGSPRDRARSSLVLARKNAKRGPEPLGPRIGVENALARVFERWRTDVTFARNRTPLRKPMPCKTTSRGGAVAVLIDTAEQAPTSGRFHLAPVRYVAAKNGKLGPPSGSSACAKARSSAKCSPVKRTPGAIAMPLNSLPTLPMGIAASAS